MNVLATPLIDIFGKRTTNLLEKHLSLYHIGDLLSYYPKRLIERGDLKDFTELNIGEEISLIGYIVGIRKRSMKSRKGKIVEITITDSLENKNNILRIIFFNQYGLEQKLVPGTKAIFFGKIGEYLSSPVLTNPAYQILEESSDTTKIVSSPIPVYAATAKIASSKIHKIIISLLQHEICAKIVDPIPPKILSKYGHISLITAYRFIHMPDSAEQWYKGRARFKFQEAFILQTALLRRKALTKKQKTIARYGKNGGAIEALLKSLPFTPTKGQKSVYAEISEDLSQSYPMNRLLQGEVGSGKTLVALLAILQVIDSGGQAVFLAPTEVLAAQHYRSITNMLESLTHTSVNISKTPKILLFTGSQTTVIKRQGLLDIVSGNVNIIIGTHALFSDKINFFDLGLVIVDEQHRFGVEQRNIIGSRSDNPPHLLVMTATPIPRTVAMTVFGDLDVSTLTELPAGRAEIKSFVVPLSWKPEWEQRIWSRVKEEIAAKHQVYVVCPRIGDESLEEDLVDGAIGGEKPLESVVETINKLESEKILVGVNIAALHGKMSPADKDSVMESFVSGKINILVSTTVIEVGVDVPNATMMVILNAERFGISQLHQLRGRVGRGGLPGLCLLVTEAPKGHGSFLRLDAVASSLDGFELSLADLKLRREGDVLGVSQSGGRSQLKILQVLYDTNIISSARKLGEQILAEDPELLRYSGLLEAIDIFVGEEKEVFLELG